MNLAALDKTIRQLMRKRNTPGLSISVIKDGETAYSKGFGCRNLKQQLPMTSDTLLGIGSITKSFTAFAIVKLQERELLSLDDSAAKYLDFEPFKSRPEITIKHMLSHSSGVPSLDAGMLSFSYTFNDFSRIYPASSRADFEAHLADAGDFILFKPGEKFFYNNDMYTCLGFIVEALSGISFEQFVRQEILQPLGMKRAVLTRDDFDKDPDSNGMTGYLFESENGRAVAKESEMPMDGYLHAPGGLYVSTNEMLNYAQCLLNKGEFNGQQLLTSESVSQLFSGAISTPYGESENPQYGLGWSIEESSEKMPYVVIHHGGGMGTSNSFLILVPALNLAVCAVENAGTGITPLICRAVVSTAMGQNPEETLEDFKIARALDEIEGTYKSAYNMYSLTVLRKAGVLQVDMETDDGSFSFPLIPSDIENLEFSVYSLRANSKTKVVFYRNKDSQKVEYAAYDRFLYRR
ncbi:serine hydrolase [SAR92 clade bacterium H455]|uniref:Serine hydrolase n=1 Tax=SAR92 clade bacterium H455 TaxID=2974818 RepID=A0ABY5TK04_9GAMM|nr:serine hydrolase [SAR92 clade bacterium H455]